jgi:hypothetical protein
VNGRSIEATQARFVPRAECLESVRRNHWLCLEIVRLLSEDCMPSVIGFHRSRTGLAGAKPEILSSSSEKAV